MPDPGRRRHDPRTEDVTYGDRRLSRPDASLPDWEVPDTAYRPIPIVWFTGAFLVQALIVYSLLPILSGFSGWLTIALAAMATGAIGLWTWDRGMKDAGAPWQAATITILLAQMIFVAIAVSHRL